MLEEFLIPGDSIFRPNYLVLSGRSWLESIKSESLEQRIDVKDSNWQFGKPEDVTIEERMTSILESDWPLFIK